jgi:hypothetical protein
MMMLLALEGQRITANNAAQDGTRPWPDRAPRMMRLVSVDRRIQTREPAHEPAQRGA